MAMAKDNFPKTLSYIDSGVDIKAGEEAVERIKKMAASTFGPQVLTGLGAFGGFFKPDLGNITSPVFISSTDSVGTKVKLAFMTGIHNTVGQDLVNHCVNDILVHGAKALFFLDYIGIDRVVPETIADLVEGLSRACKEGNLSLIGGETAELPDFYKPGEYDLVGFVVGLVDQERIINGSTIVEGDICLGLPSTGLHTNGFTLARKAVFEIAGHKPQDHIEELGMTIAEALMKIHRSYANVIHSLMKNRTIHGMAHITGGGIGGNLKRILPKNVTAEINKSTWPIPPIFDYLKKVGNIDPDDIYSAFNMGIGYILVVPESEVEGCVTDIKAMGEEVYQIGRIGKGDGSVRLF